MAGTHGKFGVRSVIHAVVAVGRERDQAQILHQLIVVRAGMDVPRKQQSVIRIPVLSMLWFCDI